MGVTMQRCTQCEKAVFPPRSVCPHCHHSVFIPATAYRGVIEETSLQRGTPPILFASIRTDLGPIVIAEVIGEGGIPGVEIDLTSLETQRSGGLFAVIPQSTVKEW